MFCDFVSHLQLGSLDKIGMIVVCSMIHANLWKWGVYCISRPLIPAPTRRNAHIPPLPNHSSGTSFMKPVTSTHLGS